VAWASLGVVVLGFAFIFASAWADAFRRSPEHFEAVAIAVVLWGAIGLAGLTAVAFCWRTLRRMFQRPPEEILAARQRAAEEWRRDNGLDYDKAMVD
jgi:hypothetical protein